MVMTRKRDEGTGRHLMSRSPASERPPAKLLSPALDKTFKGRPGARGPRWAILEVAGGVLLLLVRPNAVEYLVRALTTHEPSEDPNDRAPKSVIPYSGRSQWHEALRSVRLRTSRYVYAHSSGLIWSASASASILVRRV
jgi:hypothetical protein